MGLHVGMKVRAPGFGGSYTGIGVITERGEDDGIWIADFDGTPGGFDTDELVPAYNVGDRVRLVKDGTSTTGAVGKMATVRSFANGNLIDRGDYLLDIDPPVDYMSMTVTPNYTRATADCFVLADAIEVGKRYRTASGRITGRMERYGTDYLAMVDGHYQVFNGVGAHIFGLPGMNIVGEAALQIEAGKYYKTRDGRKVGPMRVTRASERWTDYDGRVSAFVDDELDNNGTGGHFANDGEWLTSDEHNNHHDLVAEWVDEPSSAPANDNPVAFAGYTPTTASGIVLEPNTAIVARMHNGKPRPSVCPYVHDSEAAATAEAERLAGKHPGTEFAVFTMAARRIGRVTVEAA